MNRKVAVGLVFFFAVLCIALMGGQSAAVAGHGCHGCAGVVACGGCDGAVVTCAAVRPCCGPVVVPCHGRVRCHGLNLCHGLRRHCCGPVVTCGCAGEVVVPAAEKAPEQAPEKAAVPDAPKEPAKKQEARLHGPTSFFQVSFRQ